MQRNHSCQLILALDIEDKKEAIDLVNSTGDQLEWIKVGLQMFTKYGPDYIHELSNLGKKIFLDLKLHDIPNTVAKAIESLSALPIDMLTLHTCGGLEMMQWAVKAQENSKPDLQLLGVTVLTSMDDNGLRQMDIRQSAAERVVHLAGLAQEAGMSGLVCSTHEVVALKEKFGKQFKLVTPGVRPAGSATGDQKRIMTPGQAREAGSDYIVVGRPIIQAANPAEAVASITKELTQ
ncbi:orotidine-5'-phosphate decarboxylase [Puniceicoccaceae bacterium K14]|nr:orotidine-5'-phosphate decarboxylase [Puniceicoccaceae bacterium K14]